MSPHPTGPGLALSMALATCVTLTQAQTHNHSSPVVTPSTTAPVPASESWTRANESVGQFPRGHIDLLRWEQSNVPSVSPDNPAVHAAAPLSLAQALHMAMHNQPRWLGRTGMSAAELARLNTEGQARVLQVRRAWIEAVAARQSAHYSQQILQAAEAGTELAERMARVGNWSRARQMQEELLLWDARTRLHNAELEAVQSALALWQLTGDPQADKVTVHPNNGAGARAPLATPMSPHPLAQTAPEQHAPSDAAPSAQSAPKTVLPAWLQLPPLPDLPMPERQALALLEERALAANAQWTLAQADAARLLAGQHANSLTQARQAMAQALASAPAGLSSHSTPLLPGRTPWSHSTETALQAQADADALQRRIRADVRVAHAAYDSARTQAAHSRNEVLRLHTALQQESQLRYNGMLHSTWDLLASARQRIQSVDAAHRAQRQAWLAWADLQAVISGLPYTGRSGSASGTDSTAPSSAGH